MGRSDLAVLAIAGLGALLLLSPEARDRLREVVLGGGSSNGGGGLGGSGGGAGGDAPVADTDTTTTTTTTEPTPSTSPDAPGEPTPFTSPDAPGGNVLLEELAITGGTLGALKGAELVVRRLRRPPTAAPEAPPRRSLAESSSPVARSRVTGRATRTGPRFRGGSLAAAGVVGAAGVSLLGGLATVNPLAEQIYSAITRPAFTFSGPGAPPRLEVELSTLRGKPAPRTSAELTEEQRRALSGSGLRSEPTAFLVQTRSAPTSAARPAATPAGVSYLAGLTPSQREAFIESFGGDISQAVQQASAIAGRRR